MGWTETKLIIERLELPDAQNANVVELLTVADLLPAPQEVTVNGNDGGLSLHWRGYEVAAYEDRFETYQFSDGNTQINHWPRWPSDPLDATLIAEIRQAAN